MRDARTGVCVQTLTRVARKGFSARAQMPDPDPPMADRDLAEGMGLHSFYEGYAGWQKSSSGFLRW